MDQIKRILVVDDNRDSAAMLGLLLGKSGCAVKLAHDGLAAVEMATEFEPEIVLLDIGLPKLNGYDVCRRIRALPAGNRTVIVAITGWDESDDQERSADAGFDHRLVKPVDLNSLQNLLARSL